MVTVRTSSLCWRIMPRVARTSSVRCNGVSFAGSRRTRRARGWARWWPGRCSRAGRRLPAHGRGRTAPARPGPSPGERSGGQEGLHDQREPRRRRPARAGRRCSRRARPGSRRSRGYCPGASPPRTVRMNRSPFGHRAARTLPASPRSPRRSGRTACPARRSPRRAAAGRVRSGNSTARMIVK